MNIIRIVFAENNSCYNKRYFKVTKKKTLYLEFKKVCNKTSILIKEQYINKRKE